MGLKHTLHMHSLQNAPKSIENLTTYEKNKIYTNFRNRVKKKNTDMYRDKGTKPCMLRMLRKGSLFDAEVHYLVEIGSFSLTYSGSNPKEEIGFTARVKNQDGVYYTLCVLKKQFTAVLDEIVEWNCYTIKKPCYCRVFNLFMNGILIGHYLDFLDMM